MYGLGVALLMRFLSGEIYVFSEPLYYHNVGLVLHNV